MIEKNELELMKKRLAKNKGNIWHGFISLSEEDSYRINSINKSIKFIKKIFPTFLNDANFNIKNIDLMCSLHTDRPHHLHIHFQFWEKEPLYKYKDGSLKYRSKGKISRYAIDKMFVKAGLYLNNDVSLYKTRSEALAELKKMTAINVAITSSDEIKKEILSLAKELPKTGRISYGSNDMKPFQKRVDHIVKLMIMYDKKLRCSDKAFYLALANRKKQIEKIVSYNHLYSTENVNSDKMEKDNEKYGYKIANKVLNMIDLIEKVYVKRQGNLVLNLAKFIKPELYEFKSYQKHKVNDIKLKRKIIISEKKVNKLFNKFLLSFSFQNGLLERDLSKRLEEIEEEIKKEKALEEKKKGGKIENFE